MTEVVVVTRHEKHKSNHCHQHTTRHHISTTLLFADWIPYLSPNQQCQSTAKMVEMVITFANVIVKKQIKAALY